LELEFADVIITTLLLANSLNVDINKSLEKKVNIIKNRG
jgi:NTP pyrophosphatase (non-canonical NTP hydrolase)